MADRADSLAASQPIAPTVLAPGRGDRYVPAYQCVNLRASISMIQAPTERGRKPLKAAGIMTREVIAVRPDTPARSIAMLLFKRGISAVPVIDEGGGLVGMVSEGDLLPRDEIRA